MKEKKLKTLIDSYKKVLIEEFEQHKKDIKKCEKQIEILSSTINDLI